MLRFYELLLVLFWALYMIYIVTVLCQLIGIFRITYQEIKIGKALIPFYYWFKRNLN